MRQLDSKRTALQKTGIVLIFTALVCRLLYFFVVLVEFNRRLGGDYVLYFWVDCAFNIVPCLILVLYIFSKKAGRIVIPCTYGLLAGRMIFTRVFDYLNWRSYSWSASIDRYLVHIRDLVFPEGICILLLIVTALYMTRRKSGKVLPVVTAIVTSAYTLLTSIDFFRYFDMYIMAEMSTTLLMRCSEIIAAFSLPIALPLLIATKKEIVCAPVRTSENISAQQALLLLKSRYEQGAISEEEYQDRRAEIINSL